MFWDKVAWVYDLFADIYNGKTHRELCREVAELVSTTDDVLECACGTGMLTVHIAPVCHRIVATDFSHKMLRKAKTNAGISKMPHSSWQTSRICPILTGISTKWLPPTSSICLTSR